MAPTRACPSSTSRSPRTTQRRRRPRCSRSPRRTQPHPTEGTGSTAEAGPHARARDPRTSRAGAHRPPRYPRPPRLRPPPPTAAGRPAPGATRRDRPPPPRPRRVPPAPPAGRAAAAWCVAAATTRRPSTSASASSRARRPGLATSLASSEERVIELEAELERLRAELAENANPTYAGLGGRATSMLKMAEDEAADVRTAAPPRRRRDPHAGRARRPRASAPTPPARPTTCAWCSSRSSTRCARA